MEFSFRNDRENWVIILELMYDNQMSGIPNNIDSWDDLFDELENTTILVEQIDLSPDEIVESMNYLERLNLIKNTPAPLSLTQDGFQVAHQIKTERQQRTTNRYLLTLTFLLFVLTLVLVSVDLGTLL